MLADAVAGLPPIRATLDAHGFLTRKALGQHFLLDLNLTRRIARLAHIHPDDSLIEIGAGPGGLTRALFLEGARRVYAVEKDPRALPLLQPLQDAVGDALTLVHDDATTCALWQLGDAPRKVVANLPYNVGTTIVIALLHNAAAFTSFTLMLQKEVAERLVAAPNSKAYGRLAILTQTVCEARMAFPVSPQAFVPPPTVTSAVVHLIPKPVITIDLHALEAVTAAAFGQRRKMLRQSLKSLFPDVEATLAHLGIDPRARAEALPLSAFHALAQRLS